MLCVDFFLDFILMFILIFFSWFFFLKNNFITIRLNFNFSDKLKNSNILKKQKDFFFNSFSFLLLFYFILIFFFKRGCTSVFFAGHCYVDNFNLYIIFNSILVLFFLYLILENTSKLNIVLNNDYFFSLINIGLFVPLIFYTNTIYSFVFILELLSIIIFYKFVVSKFWIKQDKISGEKKNLMEKIFSRSYVNVLFFQYWVNFFSSVIILFSIINIVTIYGSTEWFFLNLINLLNKESFYLIDFEFNFIFWIPFFIAFFLKIGLTPSHLFKIEVYKGIPFISIFFYTTYYFLIYFVFFIIFVKHYLSTFQYIWWFFFFGFCILGLINVIALLFDVIFTKAFFAYSTVVNSLGFFILIVSTI